MSVWRHLTRGLRGLTRRTAVDHEVDDEVRHYFEEATADLIARGRSPEEARRATRLELGTVSRVSEEVRTYGWENVVGHAVADLRYGARRLRATPGFTAIAVLTLAIGIGGTTAIVSAVDPILFEPLPYPQPNRIVSVLELHADSIGSPSGGTFAMYRRFAERSRALDSIAVFKPWQPAVTGVDQPERLAGQRVSAAYFHVLGVAPAIGRDFDPGDDRVHGPNVTVLGDALWRRHFGADPTIIGRQIKLDDDLFTVIGVMPAAFENVLASQAGLWALMQYDASLPSPQGREWGHHLRTIGRLRSGVRVEDAARELNAIGRAAVAELHPDTYDPNTLFSAVPLKNELTRGVRPALLVILGAVTVVMLIACGNVTNLLLARGVQRRGEFALRAALGAGRRRLTRQLLTESLLLAALGGAGGLAVAGAGVRALVALVPPGLPRAGAISINPAMFGFGLVVTTLIGLAVGLVPALQAAHSDPQSGLAHGSRHTGSHVGARRVLVVAEIALALVLLVSSGLLLRSMQRLFAVPIGFDASNLLTLQVQETGHRFREDAARYQFWSAALEAVRRVPGATAVGFTSQLPFSGDRDEYGARFPATPTRPAHTLGVFRYAVSPGYLEAMQIPLVRGRLLDEHDGLDAPLVAVISESAANQAFHGVDPIGQQLRIGGALDAPPFTIVGVVGDVKQLSLMLTDAGAVYHTMAQGRWVDSVASLVVRARGDAASLAPAIRQAIWSVDRDQPVARVATMERLLAASAAERRFALMLFEAFAIAALILATAGIYGVLAGSVAERRREIGVRSALGATRSQIVALVLRQGLTMTAIGVGVGFAGAVLATQALMTLLFGISRLDPATYAGVIVLLFAASALACWMPAWRAARVDPSITLRAE